MYPFRLLLYSPTVAFWFFLLADYTHLLAPPCCMAPLKCWTELSTSRINGWHTVLYAELKHGDGQVVLGGCRVSSNICSIVSLTLFFFRGNILLVLIAPGHTDRTDVGDFRLRAWWHSVFSFLQLLKEIKVWIPDFDDSFPSSVTPLELNFRHCDGVLECLDRLIGFFFWGHAGSLFLCASAWLLAMYIATLQEFDLSLNLFLNDGFGRRIGYSPLNLNG